MKVEIIPLKNLKERSYYLKRLTERKALPSARRPKNSRAGPRGHSALPRTRRIPTRARVWAEARDSRVRFFCQDKGIGIEKEKHEKIFEILVAIPGKQRIMPHLFDFHDMANPQLNLIQ